MKWTARVSSKGQITIPRELRDCLGIQPNDTLELALDGDSLVLRQRPVRTWRELRGFLPATGRDPDDIVKEARTTHIERKYGRTG